MLWASAELPTLFVVFDAVFLHLSEPQFIRLVILAFSLMLAMGGAGLVGTVRARRLICILSGDKAGK